jgi:hypothetical protein
MILIFFLNVTYFNVFQIVLRVATRDVLKVTLGILGNNNSCYAPPLRFGLLPSVFSVLPNALVMLPNTPIIP